MESDDNLDHGVALDIRHHVRRGNGMITRDAAHRYTDTDTGIVYPSVTTILDVLGATFSVAANYGARHASLAAVDLAPELPKLIETVGREGAAKAIAQAGNKYRDEAAQLGTDVHNLADMLVRGVELPATMTDTQRKRVEHYARWWEASRWRLRLSEAMVLHPARDHEQDGWAGTLDLLAYDDDDRTVLADIKTGKGIYREAVLQVTGYGLCSLVQPSLDTPMVASTVYPMPLPDRYVILHVTADNPVRVVEVAVGTAERMAFLSCLDLYHWNESMKGKRL